MAVALGPAGASPELFEQFRRLPTDSNRQMGVFMESDNNDKTTWFGKFRLFCGAGAGTDSKNELTEANECYTNVQHLTEEDNLETLDHKHQREIKEANHVLEEFWLHRYEKTNGNEHDFSPVNDVDIQTTTPSRTSWHGFNTDGNEQRSVKPSLFFTKKPKGNSTGQKPNLFG